MLKSKIEKNTKILKNKLHIERLHNKIQKNTEILPNNMLQILHNKILNMLKYFL